MRRWTRTICYNEKGVTLLESKHCTVTQNNFIENGLQASDDDPDANGNVWDENFWSDHLCLTPNPIAGSAGSQDSNPLCNPWEEAPPCDCGYSGSICGFKFHDFNRDGDWTICQRVLLRNDFNQKPMVGWEVYADRGTWAAEQGFLKQTNKNAPDSVILYKDFKYVALSYRASITPVAGNRDFGLVFIAQNETDYYLFRVNGEEGKIGVYRRSGSSYATIIEKTFAEIGLPFAVENQMTYGMKVNARVKENTVHLYFDTIEKFDKDGEFVAFSLERNLNFGCTGGYLGVWANLSTIKVDWVQNSAEPGVGGFTMNLGGPVGYSVVTDQDGSYCFVGLPIGSYIVTENLLAGWTQTFPVGGTHAINLLEDGQSETCVNFGNYYTPSLRVRVKVKAKR